MTPSRSEQEAPLAVDHPAQRIGLMPAATPYLVRTYIHGRVHVRQTTHDFFHPQNLFFLSVYVLRPAW